MALIPPFFLDCVAAVGVPVPGEAAQYRATGFLFGRFLRHIDENNKRYRIYFVTNRHVLKDHRALVLRFNPQADTPAKEYNLNLFGDDNKPLWLAHDNPAIDVAVIPINAQLLINDNIQFSYFRNDEHVVDRAKAKELGFSEGDGLYILGFPMGLVGVQRNFIIARQGSIARLRDCLQGQENTFLADCPVFPGNSGGPVVSRPEIVSVSGTAAIASAYLLGVVASYVPYRDTAVSLQTQQPRIVFEENSGLSHVFPSDYISEVVEKFPDDEHTPSESGS